MINKFLQLLTLLVISIFQVHAIELIKWDRTPIKLTINQDDERMIFIDKNISVGIPTYLDQKVRIQSLGGVIYVKSFEPFNESRLMLRDLETNEIILIDLTGEGKSKNKLESVKIVFEDEFELNTNASNVKQDYRDDVPTPIKLTRYAAQNFYAPLRAIENVPGIKQISLPPMSLKRLIPSLPVHVTSMAAWRLNGYEVVGIKLTNVSQNRLKLDPRLLNGDFYSATFQHNTLGEHGTPSDTTMVYIVTKGSGSASRAFYPDYPELELPDNNNDEKKNK